jgi:uncharacterized protein YcsI (UPF0317 family)
MDSVSFMTPKEARQMIRDNQWIKPTAGVASGYTQANLVILPKKYAFDFLLFCQRNPKPCPILDVTDMGDPHPPLFAPDADLRVDLPKYRVYRYGELVEEPTDLLHLWNEDLVAFLIGCSFTFEKALLQGGIPVRHIEAGCNVPMYKTNINCKKAGPFEGPMVVSMRPIPEHLVVKAVEITSRYPNVHGAPVHIGNPSSIGIRDLENPDFGDRVVVGENEVPVFWACGVTPQAVAMHVKPEIMITHAPGHMFITDVLDENLR